MHKISFDIYGFASQLFFKVFFNFASGVTGQTMLLRGYTNVILPNFSKMHQA